MSPCTLRQVICMLSGSSIRSSLRPFAVFEFCYDGRRWAARRVSEGQFRIGTERASERSHPLHYPLGGRKVPAVAHPPVFNPQCGAPTGVTRALQRQARDAAGRRGWWFYDPAARMYSHRGPICSAVNAPDLLCIHMRTHNSEAKQIYFDQKIRFIFIATRKYYNYDAQMIRIMIL